MAPQPARRRSFLGVALALAVVPVLAVSALAYYLGDDSNGLALAQGAGGGVFHPVAGDFELDGTALADCRGKTDYACLQQAFGNIAYERGARAALALFEERMRTDRRVRGDCHRIVHMIGSATYARFDENVARTFAAGSPVCASGYYHGILERAFIGAETEEQLVDLARDLCRSSGVRRRGFLDQQCQHGLGHGLMIQTGYDLPVTLSVCSRLETGWDGVSCAGGAFMENVVTSFGYRSPWLRDDDPLYPCDELARQHRVSCHLRAPVRILAARENDFAEAGATCASLAPQFATACFRGLGREAAVAARYRSPGMIRNCLRLETRRGDCMFGAARTVGERWGLEDGARRAARMCSVAPTSLRGQCFGGAGIIVGLVYPSDSARRRACARLAGAHAGPCARAAIAEVHPSGRWAWG